MRRLLALLMFMVCGAGLLPAAEPLDELEARLEAAEAVHAVKRLQHAYGHYLQAGRWADTAALFTTDARAEFPDGQAQGRKAIGELFMKRAGRNGEGLVRGQLNAHLQLQPIVTVSADGRSVKATWHEFAMLGEHGKSAGFRGGVYENEYAFEREAPGRPGHWKISRLRYFPQYEGDYDAFGHKAPPRWNIPYHYEARLVGVSVPAVVAPGDAAQCPASAAPACADVERRQREAGVRLTRLQDEIDVQNLQHAFGYYLDRKMWDDIAELFAADGELKIADAPAARGAQAIRAALVKEYGAGPLQQGELFDHVLMGTVVDVPDQSGPARSATQPARAYSTQLAMLGRVGDYAAWELGAWEGCFVKEQGKWKLRTMRYRPTLITDYDQGWARDWRPKAGQKALAFDLPALRESKPSKGRSGDAVAPTLEALQLALQRVIAVGSTENLMSHYGYTIDESDWNAMADAYSVDRGAKEITGIGTYGGRERIREILMRRGPKTGRTPDFFTIHQLTQPVIHVAEDGLSSKARLRLFQDGGSADGSSGSWIGGIYENTAVFEDGEWKFGVQDLHHSFNASYRNGWARVGGVTRLKSQGERDVRGRDVVGGGIRQGLGGMTSGRSYAEGFPPDRPIRARQYTFPQVSEPAFHYRNPVSGRAPAELVN